MRIPAIALLLGIGLTAGCTESTQYGLDLKDASHPSNPPTLAWAAFPPSAGTEITEVTYELCVIREKDGALAYSRKGLVTTQHTLDQPLDDATAYRWSVRPWFTFEGGRRVGPWAQKLPKDLRPGQTFVPVPSEYFARFSTPR